MTTLPTSSPVLQQALDQGQGLEQVSAESLSQEMSVQQNTQKYFRSVAEETLARFKANPETFSKLV